MAKKNPFSRNKYDADKLVEVDKQQVGENLIRRVFRIKATGEHTETYEQGEFDGD